MVPLYPFNSNEKHTKYLVLSFLNHIIVFHLFLIYGKLCINNAYFLFIVNLQQDVQRRIQIYTAPSTG